MATISNGESGSSVRTKLNEIINKVEGVTSIDNDIDITGTLTSDGLTVEQSGNDVSIVSRNTSNNASVATSSSLKLGITSTVGTHDSEIKVVENAVNSNTTRMEFYNYFGGTLYKNMSILGNGGISFYENTGTTAKFFWDASAESLTLGASSEPSVAAGELNLVGASTTNNTAQASLSFFDGGSNDLATVKSYRGGSFSDGELAFEVAQGGAAPAEAMRIDSSGHLLVGTTNTSPATNNVDGAVLRNEGHINVSRSGGVVGYFNRGTSDGTILDLRKDGSTVGSIGTKSGLLFIETGDAGLTFDNSNNRIFPSNDGSASDNNLDLGHSSARFKDLYLSGGVYLGGTGAANKLDDYEEGTWTPVVADAATGGNTAASATTSGTYTKVGRLVKVDFYVSGVDTTGMTSSNDLHIRGLPFTNNSVQSANGVVDMRIITFSSYPTVYLGTSATDIRFFEHSSGGGVDATTVSEISSSSYIFASISYTV